MGPSLGASGVFYEKPPLERLLALGALLERDKGSPRAFAAVEQR